MSHSESGSYSNSNVGATINPQEGIEGKDALLRGSTSTSTNTINDDGRNNSSYTPHTNNNNNRSYNSPGVPPRGSRKSMPRRNDNNNIQGSYDRNKQYNQNRGDSGPDSPMNRSQYNTKLRSRNDSGNYNQSSPMMQSINMSNPPSMHSSPSMSYQNSPMMSMDAGYAISQNIPRPNMMSEQQFYTNSIHISPEQPRYQISPSGQPIILQYPQQQYFSNNPHLVQFANYPTPMYAPLTGQMPNSPYIRQIDARSQIYNPIYAGGAMPHSQQSPQLFNGIVPVPHSINGANLSYQYPIDHLNQHVSPQFIVSPNTYVNQSMPITSNIPIIPVSAPQQKFQQSNNTSTNSLSNMSVNSNNNSNSNLSKPTSPEAPPAPKRKQLVVLDKEGNLVDLTKKSTGETLPINSTEIKDDSTQKIDLDKETIEKESTEQDLTEKILVDNDATIISQVTTINLNSVDQPTLVVEDSSNVSEDQVPLSEGNDNELVISNDSDDIETKTILSTDVSTEIVENNTLNSNDDNNSNAINDDNSTVGNQVDILPPSYEEVIEESQTDLDREVSPFSKSDSSIDTADNKTRTDSNTESVVSVNFSNEKELHDVKSTPVSTFSEIPVYINPQSTTTTSETSGQSWRSNSNKFDDKKLSSIPVVVNKSNKKSAKNKYDYKESGMLDAYTPNVETTTDNIAETPKEIPSVVEPTVVTPAPVEEPDEWEDAADQIETGEKKLPPPIPIKAEPVKETRQLRPLGPNKLNQGFSGKPQPRLSYTREELLKIKLIVFSPDTHIERPSSLNIYSSIVNIDTSSGEQRSTSIDRVKEERANPKIQQSNWTKGYLGNQPITRSANYVTENVTSQDSNEPSAWKREAINATQINNNVNIPIKNNRSRGPPPPMPKKTITDPVEVLTAEMRSILNKITPQTFEKLANNIKEMKISNSLLLDRLVSLIFEKAIYEQNFSNLYAELCHDLEKSISTWSFLHVVFDKDQNQYYWIKDCQFIDDTSLPLAGPYNSIKDCLNEITSDTPPLTRPIPYKLELNQVIVSSNVLIKVYKNLSNSSEEQFYAGFMSVNDIDESCISSTRFSNYNDAEKNSKKKNSVKSRLLTLCQNDFNQASSKGEIYCEIDGLVEELKKNRKNMKAEDILLEEQKIEEIQSKWKRRMLGLIRFIGELFKKGMVSSNIIYSCIDELLKESKDPQNPEALVWKQLPAEQDIESLCKLIRTIGSTFCSNNKKTDMTNFDACFTRMIELSKDKKLNSRLRFSLEEIIELRKNNWIERRQQEGPSKIEEIHKKAAEEEYLKNIANQRLYSNNRQTQQQNNNQQVRFDYGKTKIAVNEQFNRQNSEDKYKNENHIKVDPMQIQRKSLNNPNVLSKTLVDDFLSTSNIDEAKEIINDSNSSLEFLTTTITYIFDKYVNATHSEIHNKLIELIKILESEIRSYKQNIWQCITSLESLRLLPDYSVDCKLAPELYGQLIGYLIRLNVIDSVNLTEFIQSVRQENLDNGNPEDMIDVAFNRLISSALK